MRVLVDTCVWSKVLRRKSPDKDLTALLTDLIADFLRYAKHLPIRLCGTNP